MTTEKMMTDKRYWPEAIVVTWIDAQIEHSSLTRFDAKSQENLAIQTMGWLVHEDEVNLVIARDMWVEGDQIVFRDTIIIPTRSVEIRGWMAGIKNEDRQVPTWR